ncbi:hypothetical protein BpHYR1_004800 [Brachionus plicatilis]|uniref:Uncharacterized protein n=1 Tax=Brachionus plicatilis TaxID=10195 RepID=A0A3M7PXG3_BRAPC|nr:hypothetical protein BpHYR1_004800 [Brachionus plicatilis]
MDSKLFLKIKKDYAQSLTEDDARAQTEEKNSNSSKNSWLTCESCTSWSCYNCLPIENKKDKTIYKFTNFKLRKKYSIYSKMVNVQKATYDSFVAEQKMLVDGMVRRIADLERKYNEVLKENQELSNKLNALENKERSNNSQPVLFADLFKKNKLDNVETNILNAIRLEKKEEDKKSKNVLIFGTDFTEDAEADKETVDEISDAIGMIVLKVHQFLLNKSSKISMLKNAKELRKRSHFYNIYINPDLTFAERELSKKLVTERNDKNKQNDCSKTGFRYGIRDFEVVRIKIGHDNLN